MVVQYKATVVSDSVNHVIRSMNHISVTALWYKVTTMVIGFYFFCRKHVEGPELNLVDKDRNNGSLIGFHTQY